MRCFPKQKIEDAIPTRKEGYIEEVRKRDKSEQDSEYCLEQDDINYLKSNFRKDMEMPSIVQMAKNAVQAGVDEVKARANHEPPITEEEESRRLSICAGCEFYTPNIVELSDEQKKQNRCVKCGCYMNFKTKLRSAHCPVGKW
jgi:hypothetical protein